MIWGCLRCGDLRQVSWANNLKKLFVLIQGEDLCTDLLDTRIDHIEAIFPRINIRDDSIVDVDERFLSFRDTCKETI